MKPSFLRSVKVGHGKTALTDIEDPLELATKGSGIWHALSASGIIAIIRNSGATATNALCW